ncbi:lymphocyte activation gene 3 protein-like, partial [Carcharodon carcharias]|uniref:lymphocyte activation gene 3 protein-like n=1 Tax=Carcharodon carcharias TaxID=13397 RepID=UPI001B7F501F
MALPHHWMVRLLLLSIAHASRVLSLPGLRVLSSEGSDASLPCLDSGSGRQREGFRKLDLRWTRERVAAGRYPLLMLGSDGVVKRGLSEPSQRARVSGERVEAGDYSLNLRGVRAGDSGTYHCLVRHGNTRLEEAVKLHVVQVRLVSEGFPVEGGELGLLCEISSHLPGARTSWHRGGSPVPATGRFRTEEGGRRLNIAELEPQDRGDWECRVAFEAQTVSAWYLLQIFGFLEAKRAVPAVYARPGTHALLSLALAPGTAGVPLRWGWLRGRGVGSRPAGNVPPLAGASLRPGWLSLSLAPALPSDRGLFTGYLNTSGSWIERTVRLEFVE